MTASLIQDLQARGLIAQTTDIEALSTLLNEQKIALYCGFDPTADSLHIGHLLPVLALRRFQQAGHTPIALVGGATGMIGDPSFKAVERSLNSAETVAGWVESIRNQLKPFLSFEGENAAIMANNADWFGSMNCLDFLRDIGKHFSVNAMLNKESVKQRIDRDDVGISFTEFAYTLLQSYDFLMLHKKYHCLLQIGGDDQWGNIVAGVDLVRRKTGNEVFGLTFPLITRSDGKKMGKSEKGALFLDKTMTSVYDFFQYWRNVDDADVRRFMLLFTFLSIHEIETICAGNINQAKERLAWEVTKEIHGKEEADTALAGAKAAFSGSGDKTAMPTVEMAYSVFEQGISVIDLFTASGLCATKSDARRLIEQGGALVAGASVTDLKASITTAVLDETGELVLRAGKKRFVRIVTR